MGASISLCAKARPAKNCLFLCGLENFSDNLNSSAEIDDRSILSSSCRAKLMCCKLVNKVLLLYAKKMNN